MIFINYALLFLKNLLIFFLILYKKYLLHKIVTS